ncbi:MAG: ATP-binding protein [Anaerolineales bacterium]
MSLTVTEQNLTTITLISESVIYLLIALTILRQRNFRAQTVQALGLYAVVSLLLALFQVSGRLAQPFRLADEFLARVPLYGALGLAVIFLQLTRSFLRLEQINRNWWWLGAAWLVVLALLDSNPFRLPEVLVSGAGWLVRRDGFVRFALVLGWATFIGSAAWLTLLAYRRIHQPLHRNRIKYWLPVLGLIITGDTALFAGLEPLGGALHGLGALVAAYVVLRHRLPDVRQSVRRVLSFSITTLLALVLYGAAFILAEYFIRVDPAAQPFTGLTPSSLIAGLAMALILVIVFNPMLGVVQRQVNRLTLGARYDPHSTVGQYSLSISNILNLERLATIAIGLINEAMGIERGALFLVDQEKDEQGHEYFCLRGVRGLGGEVLPSGKLAADSPVAEYLRHEYGPLTQYDIDLLPRFRATPDAERDWLASLNLDVYVPIYAKGKWIGLIALGPKRSRDRYFDEDLALLSTLADQTAVALENARLVEDLVKLNHDIRQAYAALDLANQQLEHLDRVKSDFINILSHELRTPLTILIGYAEILLEDEALKDNPYQSHLMKGITSGTSRLREVIDSMFDVAKIDSRMLQLHPNPVALAPLILEVCDGLRKPLDERKLTLTTADLNGLPAIEADLEAMRKVFHHLIVNAIKFTPDGGKITISGRAVPEAEKDGQVELIISDTGIGIDPRFQELIFTKFYQTGEVALHSTGKTKFKGGGPGLGLAIARGIVEAHGGRMWAESPGYDEQSLPGSHFHVILPVQRRLLSL